MVIALTKQAVLYTTDYQKFIAPIPISIDKVHG